MPCGGETKNDEFSPVFIIRIWRELREKPDQKPEWRGVIEHLQSNEKVYFIELDDVVTFINHYLNKMGVVQATTQKNDRFFQRMIAALQGKRRNE